MPIRRPIQQHAQQQNKNKDTAKIRNLVSDGSNLGGADKLRVAMPHARRLTTRSL